MHTSAHTRTLISLAVETLKAEKLCTLVLNKLISLSFSRFGGSSCAVYVAHHGLKANLCVCLCERCTSIYVRVCVCVLEFILMTK